MLLTIFNLPATTRYVDIKSLIHSKCGFKEVILDNLTSDGNNTKKVTVGLAEEEDAAILVRKINGLYIEGQHLYVETIKKKKQPNIQGDLYNQQVQSSYSMGNQNVLPKKPTGPGSINQSGGPKQPTLQQPYYQQSYQQPSYELGFTDMQQTGAAAVPPTSYPGIYGTTQNAFANYGYPQQMQFQSSQMTVSYEQTAPLGFGNQGNSNSVWSEQNDWNSGGNSSGGNKISQQSRTSTRWDNSGESNSRSRRDAPARDQGRDAPGRDRGRDEPARSFGRDAPSRDFGRDGGSREFGRDGSSREFGRDGPSRDFGWVSGSGNFVRDGGSRDFVRDGGSRDVGRDGGSRDFGRDGGSRSFGRDDGPRDFGRSGGSRDFGRDGGPRDFGRNETSRDFGRNGPSRDFGRNAPTREGRDGTSRNNSRDAPMRDRGRDEPRNQERGASVRGRDRDASVRDRYRDQSTYEPNRNAPNRRNEPIHVPQKRQFQSCDAPPPLISKLPLKPVDKNTNQFWSEPQSRLAANSTLNVMNSEVPPAKKMRRPPIQTRSQTKMNPVVNDTQKAIARATTWRNQAASNFAKEVLSQPTHLPEHLQVFLIKELKKLIRLRLDQICGGNINTNLRDMIQLYRIKYDIDTDAELLKQATEVVEKKALEAVGDKQKAVLSVNKAKQGEPKVQGQAKPVQAKPVQAKPAQTKPAQAKPAQNKPVQTKPAQAQPIQTTIKLPSYPQGDKTYNKELKKKAAKMFQSEDTLLEQLEPNILNAMHHEIDELYALIVGAFQDEPEPEFKTLHEIAKTEVVDEIKKMMKINFAKRILNVGPIMVRIFCIPKMVNKTILSHVLADYGVTSLRKPESKKKAPMFYGTCDTYEVYDKLCAMNPLTVSGSTISIKPFHLTGKDKKITKVEIQAHRKNIKQSFENIGVNQTADQAMHDENNEDYNQNDLTNYTDNDDNDEQEEQHEYESVEPMEQQDIENEANEDAHEGSNENDDIQIISDDNENDNVVLIDDEQPPNDNDTTDNVEITDSPVFEPKGINEGTENNANGNEAKEPNALRTDIENKNNTEVNTTQEVDKNDFTVDFDFTEGSKNKKDAFKILDDGINIEDDKELSQLNPEDLVEISGRKNYDDIDINDLNDDDLEDW